jgi:hypothetical protein
LDSYLKMLLARRLVCSGKSNVRVVRRLGRQRRRKRSNTVLVSGCLGVVRRRRR